MRLLWFISTVSLCLQLALTRTLQITENDRNSGNDKTVTVPLVLVYGGFHYAEIGIGTPPQKFKVFFDTWNQNTWITSTKCPADKYPMCANHARYDAAKSFTKNETTAEFSCVEYGTPISGTITEDIVTLGDQKVPQPFGEANATGSNTLDDATFDGTFGVGFGSTGTGYPTILESLKESGLIDKKVFGIWEKSNANGEIMFGGYNKKLYNGELEFTDVISKEQWKFNVNSIRFGKENMTGDKREAYVNGGSHHIYGPPDQVHKIYEKLGCKPPGGCTVNCSKISTFPDLKIIVSKKEFTISPQDYIDKEGDECTCRIFSQFQHIWIFGNLFLDKVYTAYDTEKGKIGFAEASQPKSTLSPTPRSTTTKTTVSTSEEPTTQTEEPTTPTTEGPQPTTTSAASTLFSHHISTELVMVMAVLRYPLM